MPTSVKCSCQHCGNHIEFDTSRIGQTVACPHCSLETLLVVPGATPELPNPGSPNIELRHGAYALGIAALILGIIACVFYWTPFLEPFFLWIAIVGVVLATAGLIMARINNKTGFVFPIIGLVICSVPLMVDAAVIGGSAALLKIEGWRAERAAHAQELAAAKAQMKTYQHELPLRANDQVRAYLLDLRNLSDAEFQIKMGQTNVALQEAVVDNAQQQFNQTKADYDRFMATNSFVTNAVYVKISQRLSSVVQQRAATERSIWSLQSEIANLTRASGPVLTWNVNPRTGASYAPDPAGVSKAGQIQQDKGYLSAAEASLPVLDQNIAAVQQQLSETPRITTRFPTEVQENKLHDAESVLGEAASRLVEARAGLDAAKQRMDEYKNRAESDLAAAKSVVEEERSTTFSYLK